MRTVLAVAVALLAALTPPARAATTTVVAYNDGTRGFIDVTVTPDLTGRAAPDDLHAVNAQCHFHHVFGSSAGTMTIAVVGRVVAGARVLFGTDGAPDTTVPVGTVVTCVAKSGTGVEREVTRAAPGPAASAGGLVELPVDDVTICVRASALFTDGEFVLLEERCRASAPSVVARL